jgi:hypothetical protein
MVDNDEYVNDNLIINYDSKRFSLDNCLNSHRNNQTDIHFHSKNKRRKFFIIKKKNSKSSFRYNKTIIKR